jgi:hypothetical protein
MLFFDHPWPLIPRQSAEYKQKQQFTPLTGIAGGTDSTAYLNIFLSLVYYNN